MMRLTSSEISSGLQGLTMYSCAPFLHGGDGGIHRGVGGDDDDGGLGVQPADLHHGLDAVHAAGHLEVDEVDGVVAWRELFRPPRGRRRRCPRGIRPRAARRRAIRTSPLRRPRPEFCQCVFIHVNSLGIAAAARAAQGAQNAASFESICRTRGGERHGAGPLRTVHQPEQVAGLVQRFLVGALAEKPRGWPQAVKLLPQARQRDHADAAAQLRLAVRRRSAPG